MLEIDCNGELLTENWPSAECPFTSFIGLFETILWSSSFSSGSSFPSFNRFCSVMDQSLESFLSLAVIVIPPAGIGESTSLKTKRNISYDF